MSGRALAFVAVVLLAGCRPRPAASPVTPPPAPPAPPEPSPPPAPAGVWVGSDVYDLRVVSVTRCWNGQDRHRHVGVEVAVRSKTGPLFVAPRDVSLRAGGLLFPALTDPRFVNCRPALTSTQLRRDQGARGFVVFEVADAARDLVLEYAPRRWGGAGQVRVALPPAVATVVAGR
jgi:hypothetical protein